jgi:hypothetical protein
VSGLREALEKLVQEWRYTGEDLKPWQEGGGPDPSEAAMDDCADELKRVLAAHPEEQESRWPGYGVCTAEGRWGQCVFVAGHHEVENWTPHADRFGRTWNDQPVDDPS